MTDTHLEPTGNQEGVVRPRFDHMDQNEKLGEWNELSSAPQ